MPSLWSHQLTVYTRFLHVLCSVTYLYGLCWLQHLYSLCGLLLGTYFFNRTLIESAALSPSSFGLHFESLLYRLLPFFSWEKISFCHIPEFPFGIKASTIYVVCRSVFFYFFLKTLPREKIGTIINHQLFEESFTEFVVWRRSHIEGLYIFRKL